ALPPAQPLPRGGGPRGDAGRGAAHVPAGAGVRGVRLPAARAPGGDRRQRCVPRRGAAGGGAMSVRPMSLRPLRLGRRAVLRGAGAFVALPVLEAMLGPDGTAYASGAPLPLRLGIFFFGNGVIRSRWVPSAVGATWSLSEEMQPLVNVKDYLSA